MELRHLRYFLTAAETESFTAAAKRLGIAQPSLSIQIQRLEEDLGLKLFERGNRKVSLTPAGRSFLSSASNALKELDAAVARLQDGIAGRAGVVRLRVDDEAWSPKLLKRLRKLKRKCRGIELEIVTNGEGPVDATILTTQDAEEEGFELERAAVCVALSAKHRLADRSSISSQDLVGEVFLISPENERSVAETWLLTQVLHQATPLSAIAGSLEHRERLAAIGLGFAASSSARRDLCCTSLIPFEHGEGQLRTLLKINPQSDAPAVLALSNFLQESETAPARPPED